MSWRGIDGAIAAAKAGHDTVLSPAPDLYLDHWQSAGDISPGPQQHAVAQRWCTSSIRCRHRSRQNSANTFSACRRNLWAEMMRTEARVTYMAFPRIAALAEVAWSPADRINWDDFQRRLEPQLAALRPRWASSMRAKWSVEAWAAPSREPRPRAMRRRLRAVARRRCADRGRARRVPGEHHRPLLDLARRRPHQGQVDPRATWARSRSTSRSARTRRRFRCRSPRPRRR